MFPSNHPRPWFEVVRFGEAKFGFESSSEPSCRVVVVWNGRGSGCASGVVVGVVVVLGVVVVVVVVGSRS